MFIVVKFRSYNIICLNAHDILLLDIKGELGLNKEEIILSVCGFRSNKEKRIMVALFAYFYDTDKIHFS